MAISLAAASLGLNVGTVASLPRRCAELAMVTSQEVGTKAAVAEQPKPERQIEWFPANAKELAPPIFQQRPYFKALGKSPGDSAPAHLDGHLPGDKGFDPLNLAALAKPKLGSALLDLLTGSKRKAKLNDMSEEEQVTSVAWMREAELKHARLAMLAAAGWPLAELWSPFKGELSNGRAPSLFNGHLFDAGNLAFVLLAFGGMGFLETQGGKLATDRFDPLGWGAEGLALKVGPIGTIEKTTEELRESEIKNGRLAMMAITGFAVQEFLWGSPVVQQTPIFFGL